MLRNNIQKLCFQRILIYFLSYTKKIFQQVGDMKSVIDWFDLEWSASEDQNNQDNELNLPESFPKQFPNLNRNATISTALKTMQAEWQHSTRYFRKLNLLKNFFKHFQ
jgi:hypothetical protein